MSRFEPGDEGDRQSAAFQLGVCQSLIEQVITGQLSVVGLRERYTAHHPEWELADSEVTPADGQR